MASVHMYKRNTQKRMTDRKGVSAGYMGRDQNGGERDSTNREPSVMDVRSEWVRVGAERDQSLNDADHDRRSEADQLPSTNVDETDRDRLPIITEFQELFGPQRRALPAPTLGNRKSVRSTREPCDRCSCRARA